MHKGVRVWIFSTRRPPKLCTLLLDKKENSLVYKTNPVKTHKLNLRHLVSASRSHYFKSYDSPPKNEKLCLCLTFQELSLDIEALDEETCSMLVSGFTKIRKQLTAVYLDKHGVPLRSATAFAHVVAAGSA
jgi:hypothetical protein